LEPLARKVAELGEEAVQRRDVVAFREEQVVAVGVGEPVRPHAEDALVEVDEDVGARQRRADEAAAPRRHAHDVPADAERQVAELLVLGRNGKQAELSLCHLTPRVRSSWRWLSTQVRPAWRAFRARMSGRASRSSRMAPTPKTSGPSASSTARMSA